MSADDTSKKKHEHTVAMMMSPVLRGSATLVTLPSKEKENNMELPTPILVPLDLDIETLMDVKKLPILRPSSPESIIIVVTHPSSDTETVPLSIPFPASKPILKETSLPVPKSKKATLPKCTPTSISGENNTTTVEQVSRPNIEGKLVAPILSSTSTYSKTSQPSHGNATIAPLTIQSSTRLETLHQDQETMQTIILDPPLQTRPQTPLPRSTTTTTKATTRWSSYFSPVVTPRPFSIFSTFNYNYQPDSQNLIPIASISKSPPSGGRIITWSSDERRSIGLVNERFPPDISRLNAERKERSCWENVKDCVGRSALECRKKYWEGREVDVTAYCRY